MRQIYYLICIFLIISFASCKDAYRPDIVSSAKSYLVVEGVLNVDGPASVTLTLTSKLYTSGFNPVNNAQLIVEGKDNSTRSLAFGGAGVYTSPNLNLIVGNEYRLRISIPGGKEYLSEYVKALQTPAIDSIGWTRESDGVVIYADAHDASGNTRYYRWEYDETWETKSYFFSRYLYLRASNTVRERLPSEYVFSCWKHSSSKNIILASSARLQSDIIYQAPLTMIPNGDEKLAVRYSILARQYALDKKGYDFYSLMKKNTEALGTIFDAQPSEITGNIKCVDDPTEPVIGYISASTISQKRFFISTSDIPDWTFRQSCFSFEIPNHPDSIKLAYVNNGYMPLEAIYSLVNPFEIYSYVSSTTTCGDCTTTGGSLVKPSYW